MISSTRKIQGKDSSFQNAFQLMFTLKRQRRALSQERGAILPRPGGRLTVCGSGSENRAMMRGAPQLVLMHDIEKKNTAKSYSGLLKTHG